MWHQIQLAGNLGRDPEMRYLPSGAPVTSFSVAVNKQYTKASGEQVKETIWVRVSAFGRLAEIVNQYCKKGSKVLIIGELQADQETGGPRIWGDPPKASFEITARDVRFLSSRGDGNASDAGDQPGMLDEVPF